MNGILKIMMLVVTVTMLFVVFRPLPQPTSANTSTISGVVTEVFAGKGEDDISIRLSDGKTYYINRGLEKNLKVAELNMKLKGNTVEIKYSKHLTDDLLAAPKHIAVITVDSEVVYTEL